MVKRKTLTPKQKKFVASYIKNGLNGRRASLAVQPNQTPESASVTATRTLKNANVQQAISDALAKHELTVDVAVSELKKIVEQDKELGAKRLAVKDTLELYGWSKTEKPTVAIKVSGFFGDTRTRRDDVVDID